MNKEVIVITGAKGSGKTTTAITYARPSESKKIVVVDTEGSALDLIKKMKAKGQEIGCYVDMYERLQVKEDLLNQIAQGKLPWLTKEQKSALVGYYLFFLKRMDEVLVKGKYKYLVIDTCEPIEAGMAAWVEVNRVASGWSGQRDHGKFEHEAVRPLYEAMLESFALRGIECVLMTSHLKDKWLNDKPVPGKITPGGRLALLSRLSSIMLWMVGNVGNASGAPAAIVMKARRAQVDVVDDEWVIKKPLPQRIKDFSWTEVRRYEREGCDHAQPKEGEVMTADEMDMISEFLNKEQMRLMVLGAEVELEQMKAKQMPFIGGEAFSLEAPSLAPELVEQIRVLSKEPHNLKPVQIKTQLGVSIKDVLETLKG